MIRVMCNASPIISLSIIGKLNLLWELFDVSIPEEVYSEIVNNSEKNIGFHELKDAVSSKNIKIYKVKDKSFVDKAYGILHRGELEVVIGAIENDFQVVIIDEKTARTFAQTLNLKPLGILGVLSLGKSKGKIDDIKPLLDKLIEKKFRISDNLYNQILKEAGEL